MSVRPAALEGDQLLELPHVPVFCNVLWPPRADARSALGGDIALVHQHRTDLIGNVAHDPAKTAYSPVYENSLHHSPTFQKYAEGLATRLIEHAKLDGGRVLEIGPGDGDFLELLTTGSGSTGTGFDPSHDPSRVREHAGDWEIVAEAFPLGQPVEADLIVSRHVLEHIEDPETFLTGLRASLTDTNVLVYLEVPDATYMLETPAVWDVIYEHCWYYTEAAMVGLMERCGFEVTESGRSFGDQYLWVEARPGEAVVRDVPRTAALDGFGDRCREEIDEWDRRLAGLPDDAVVALWGVGSKGVTFLNVVPSADRVSHTVDLNPHKHGHFVPISGQEVLAPESIPAAGVTHVVTLNPMYVDEVRSALADLGVDAEVLSR